MKKIKEILHNIHENKTVKYLIERGEQLSHVGYCSILYVEGHGMYATAGGVLGLFVLAHIIMGE